MLRVRVLCRFAEFVVPGATNPGFRLQRTETVIDSKSLSLEEFTADREQNADGTAVAI